MIVLAQRGNDQFFMRGGKLGKNRVLFHCFGELFWRHHVQFRTEHNVLHGQVHLAANSPRNDVIVTGEDLHSHIQLMQLFDGFHGGFFGWVEES